MCFKSETDRYLLTVRETRTRSRRLSVCAGTRALRPAECAHAGATRRLHASASTGGELLEGNGAATPRIGGMGGARPACVPGRDRRTAGLAQSHARARP